MTESRARPHQEGPARLVRQLGWMRRGVVIAQAWSLLVRYGIAAAGESAEDVSIYGPVDEYLLGGSNPQIPEPRGRWFLRDYIPGVADEIERWPALFRYTELTLHLRSYNFNREIRDDVFQEAWALGAGSGTLPDTFRIGAVSYTSRPAYAPDDRRTMLLGAERQSDSPRALDQAIARRFACYRGDSSPPRTREVRMPGARVDTIIGIALLLLLAGCQGGMPRAGVGTAAGGLGGAAAGGLLGAALGGGSTGIASGVLIGGLLGGGAGQLMDQRTQRIQSEAVARALETTPAGASSSWTNPDGGTRGSVTPLRTYQNPGGAYCREFQQSIVVGGQTQQAVSTACRQSDGTWRIQS
jgi:surface antigen